MFIVHENVMQSLASGSDLGFASIASLVQFLQRVQNARTLQSTGGSSSSSLSASAASDLVGSWIVDVFLQYVDRQASALWENVAPSSDCVSYISQCYILQQRCLSAASACGLNMEKTNIIESALLSSCVHSRMQELTTSQCISAMIQEDGLSTLERLHVWSQVCPASFQMLESRFVDYVAAELFSGRTVQEVVLLLVQSLRPMSIKVPAFCRSVTLQSLRIYAHTRSDSVAYDLALVLHDAFRDVREEERQAAWTDAVVSLLQAVESKDLFLTAHHRLMARRLLCFPHRATQDQEFLPTLRFELGSSALTGLTMMMEDVNASAQVDQLFRATGFTLPFSLSTYVLRSSAWPLGYSAPFPVQYAPSMLVDALTCFSQWYASALHSGRKVMWTTAFGSAVLEFNSRYTITCSVLQALVLLQFNDADSLSCTQLADRLGGHDASVRLAVKSLLKAIPQANGGILASEGVDAVEGASRLPDDTPLIVHGGFSCKRLRFAASQPVDPVVRDLKASMLNTQHRQELAEMNMQRVLAIEASVVKIMKARKSLSLESLFDACVRSGKEKFRVTPPLFKEAVESLLSREYIARSSSDPSQILYVS
jgi:hypothetical protein